VIGCSWKQHKTWLVVIEIESLFRNWKQTGPFRHDCNQLESNGHPIVFNGTQRNCFSQWKFISLIDVDTKHVSNRMS
jgi:hypothetical protein